MAFDNLRLNLLPRPKLPFLFLLLYQFFSQYCPFFYLFFLKTQKTDLPPETFLVTIASAKVTTKEDLSVSNLICFRFNNLILPLNNSLSRRYYRLYFTSTAARGKSSIAGGRPNSWLIASTPFFHQSPFPSNAVIASHNGLADGIKNWQPEAGFSIKK